MTKTAQVELRSERVYAPACAAPAPGAAPARRTATVPSLAYPDAAIFSAAACACADSQGLKLVHFSVQPEPFLKQKLTLHTRSYPLNTP